TAPVERVDEGTVARDQRLERQQRRRRLRARVLTDLACEFLGALEGIGELGNALGGEAPRAHQVRALVRDGDQDLGVRTHARRVGAPETRAQHGHRETGNCLDPYPPGSYHGPVSPCMETVSRLPAIYFEKLLESSPDIVVAVDRKGIIIF